MDLQREGNSLKSHGPAWHLHGYQKRQLGCPCVHHVTVSHAKDLVELHAWHSERSPKHMGANPELWRHRKLREATGTHGQGHGEAPPVRVALKQGPQTERGAGQGAVRPRYLHAQSFTG